MTAAVFPILGSVFVLLVLLPICALGTRIIFELVEGSGPLHGLGVRFALLVGSFAVPIVWFISAGVHAAESGRSAFACLFRHSASSASSEPVLFAAAVGLGCALLALPRCWMQYRSVRASTSWRARSILERMQQIIQTSPALRILIERLRVTEDPDFVLGTHGWLRPAVVVGAEFAESLDDTLLANALAHEAEHVRAHDPLRYLLLDIALAVNPLGRRFLQSPIARWIAAREAHCDRDAVTRGAAPEILAHALVRAARSSSRPSVVALSKADTKLLRLRVGLLLAFSEKKPSPCCRTGWSTVLSTPLMVALILLLPHRVGTIAIDAIHTGAERTLTFFSR